MAQLHNSLRQHIQIALVIFVVAFFVIRSASAADTDIRDFAQNLSQNLVTNFNKPGMTTAERQQVLRDYLQKYIDLDYLAKFVLGNYRRGLPEAQMRDFRNVLSENIVGTYAHWLRYSGIFTIGGLPRAIDKIVVKSLMTRKRRSYWLTMAHKKVGMIGAFVICKLRAFL